MQLSSDPWQLGIQLDWVLSSEPRTPHGSCLQTRAVRLPLAHQLALVLSAADVLHSYHATQNAQNVPFSDLQSKLMQLLHLLSSEHRGSKRGQSIQHAADLAIQQQQQAALHPCRSCQQQVQQIPAPSWLSSSTRHCFGWQSPSTRTGSAASTITQSLLKDNTPVYGANAAPESLPDYKEQQQQPTAVAGAPGIDTALGITAAQDDDLPAAKRSKLAPQAPFDNADASNSARLAAAAMLVDTDRAVQELIQQLQVLHSSCDAKSVNLHLLQQVFTASAAAPAAASSQYGPLQQHLQELSVDALACLMDRALGTQSSTVAASNSSEPSVVVPSDSCASMQGGRTSGVQLSKEVLAYVLATAVLPKVQQLTTAAPKALLACLSSLARQQLDTLVTDVLQPLLLSPNLVAVQVQLLVKLMKNVPAVQNRLLELLLLGAAIPAGHAGPSATPFMPVPGLSSCCWGESHAVLMKALLDSSPQVVSAQLDRVIAAVKAAAREPELTKSTAFGQLLMALVKAYAAVMGLKQIRELEVSTAATQTFLSKALRNKLQQLAAQHGMARV